MGEGNEHYRQVETKEISLLYLIKKILQVIKEIMAQWKLLLLFALLGTLAGIAYSVLREPRYTATCTFVLDESDKSNVLGQYAGLASLAGIDINDGGGIFKGDNIMELYRSRLMIKKTLLSEVVIENKHQKLIDRYANKNELVEKWKEHDKLGNVDFSWDPGKLSREEDSLITDIAETFNKKYLDISRPDKKLSVIKVTFTATDEAFAKLFTDHLVSNVNEFYIQTKTRKAAQNVRVLQRRSDSVRTALNSALSGVASSIDAEPNANPARISLRVPSQRRQVDVQAGNIIYGEMIKNLELAKLTLNQQTPLIQFIDQPVLPLKINHIGKVKGAVIGAVIAFLLVISVLLAKRLFLKINLILS